MSNDPLDKIQLVTSIITPLILFTALIINISLKLRRYFPARVNCWFCNNWFKVPYANKNSFDCPSCGQYNGFNSDGSYNKIIDAQHNASLNNGPTIESYGNCSNGLCDSCNYNQQLKISQLAKFTPIKEENYDTEIEHFKTQLEKTYKLCPPCNRVLRYKLLKEKASLLGNHIINIRKKGLNVFSSRINTNKSPLIKTVRTFQGFLAIFLLSNIILRYLLNQSIVSFLPDNFLPCVELLENLFILTSNILCELFFTENFMNMFTLSSLGLGIQMFLLLSENVLLTVKLNQLLCWSFLSVTLWTAKEDVIYNDVFQVFCSLLIVHHTLFESHTQDKNSMKRLEKVDDGYSDEELDLCNQSVQSFCSCTSRNLLTSRTLSNRTPTLIGSTPTNKTEIGNFINEVSPNTATKYNSYSQIQTRLEDLHLNDRSFRVDQTPSPLSRFLIAPPKLHNVTQNSWVAGGFWRDEDGTLMSSKYEIPLSRSSSQSSGFYSQINDYNNPFSSLPTSAKTSVCGDDWLSIVSEPVSSSSLKKDFSAVGRNQMTGKRSDLFKIPQTAPNNNMSPFYFNKNNPFCTY